MVLGATLTLLGLLSGFRFSMAVGRYDQRKNVKEVEAVATAQQTTIVALAVSGIGDVLNSQGYTQAAWWNRIPNAAWALMAIVALFANFLIGYGARNANGEAMLISALPVLLSIAFFLIADIESPRGGIIVIHPKNLEAPAESLHAH